MSLHCVFGPVDAPSVRRLLDLVSETDVILFFGAATRLASPDHPDLASWAARGAQLLALAEDARLYGVGETDPRVALVSYDDFLSVSEEQERQLAWR